MPPEKAVSFLTKGSPVSEMRGEIALDLQRELARVGCYAGEINGAWALSTRQAMKIFMERVNATLTIHQPDAVLLALVQSQPGNVCGTSCPAGQSRARDGRCIPTALLSRDFRQEKQPVSANAGWSATTTVASERPHFRRG